MGKDRKLEAEIKFRCSDELRKQVAKLAKKEGITFSAFVRRRLSESIQDALSAQLSETIYSVSLKNNSLIPPHIKKAVLLIKGYINFCKQLHHLTEKDRLQVIALIFYSVLNEPIYTNALDSNYVTVSVDALNQTQKKMLFKVINKD